MVLGSRGTVGISGSNMQLTVDVEAVFHLLCASEG